MKKGETILTLLRFSIDTWRLEGTVIPYYVRRVSSNWVVKLGIVYIRISMYEVSF